MESPQEPVAERRADVVHLGGLALGLDRRGGRIRVSGHLRPHGLQGLRRLRIELPPPDEDVESFDLVDQELDRTAGGRELATLIGAEARRPAGEDLQLLRIEPVVLHSEESRPFCPVVEFAGLVFAG